LRKLLTFLALALWASTTFAQQAPTAGIRGSVVQAGAADTKLSGITVELRREGDAQLSSAPLLTTITDAEGRYYFPKLNVGRYRVSASGGGFVRTEYGQKRTNGAGLPITVAANQQIPDATIPMTPTGSISGRITDANGQPVVLADVYALKAAYQEGQRTFVRVLSSKTDDRGEYRMFWMTPGLYYVYVIVPDGTNVDNLIMNGDGLDTQATLNANNSQLRDVLSRPIGTGAAPNEAHVPVYYPTVTDPQQARAIDVRAGSDVRGLDITAVRVVTRKISGTVFNGVTRQLPGTGTQVQVRLLPTDPAQQPIGSPVNPETGKFEINRVAPGTYLLYTQLRPQGSAPNQIMWGSMPLEIRDRDISDISLPAVAGVPLTGRVVLEEKNSTNPTSVAGMAVGMRPDPLVSQNQPSQATQVAGDGSFSFAALPPSKYRVYAIPMLSPNNPGLLNGMPRMPDALMNLNPYVKAIRVGGTDVLDGGLNLTSGSAPLEMEILLGTNAGVIEGRVLNENKQPVDAALVGLVPASASARGFRMDMYKTASTDASGKFELRGLPPGDYKIFSWEDVDKASIVDQDFVRLYETSGRVLHIDEGEKPTVELTVIPPVR
jgi:protocatechuate 3,4-dioxygenase beta subunit